MFEYFDVYTTNSHMPSHMYMYSLLLILMNIAYISPSDTYVCLYYILFLSDTNASFILYHHARFTYIYMYVYIYTTSVHMPVHMYMYSALWILMNIAYISPSDTYVYLCILPLADTKASFILYYHAHFLLCPGPREPVLRVLCKRASSRRILLAGTGCLCERSVEPSCARVEPSCALLRLIESLVK